jgi:PAS domain S-box-containing protein
MIDNVPGMIYRCINDENWTMEFVSEGCKELTGYEVSDLLFNRTINYAMLIHPDHRQIVWDEIQVAFQKQLPFELTYKIIDRQGEEKWVWEKGRGTFSDNNDLLTLEGFITDISAQTVAQDELRKQESLLRSIHSAAPSGIGIVKGRIIIQVNNRLLEMFGYSSEEMIGKDTRIFYETQEEYERIGRELYSDLGEKGIATLETRIVTKSGDVFEALLSSALLDPTDPKAGNVFVITDVSELKHAREQLQISEERYRMLFEKMLDGFVLFELVFDETGKPVDHRFLEVNPAYEKFTGLNASDLINKNLREVATEVSDDWIQKFVHVAITGETIRFEQFSTRNEKTFEIFAYSPKFGQFALIVSDITQRKNAEQKSLELSQNLSELVKELRCLYGASIIIEDDSITFEEKIEKIIKIIPTAFKNSEKTAVRLSLKDREFTSPNFQKTENFLAHQIKLKGETAGQLEIFYLECDRKNMISFSEEEVSLVVELSGRLGEMIARQDMENARRESEARWQGIFDNSIDGILLFDDEGNIKESNQAACQAFGYTRDEMLHKQLNDLLSPEDWARLAEGWQRFLTHRKATAEYRFRHKQGASIPFEVRASAYVLPGLHLATLRNLTEKRRHKEEQENILSMAAALRKAQTKTETIQVLLENLKNRLELDSIGLAFYNHGKNEFKYELVVGVAKDFTGQVVPVTEAVAEVVQKSLKPYIKNEILNGPDIIQTYQYLSTKTLAIIPLIAQQDLLGLIVAGKGKRFEESDVRILMSAADMGANAFQRADLFEMTRRRLEQIEALHQIDLAINANTDLNSTLNVFLEQVLVHMKVDAADILTYEESSRSLIYATGKGFNRKPIAHYNIRLGNGCAGNVAQTRRMRWSGNLMIDMEGQNECNLRWPGEGFSSYCGVPLIAKGKIKGVLELFHRKPLQPDDDWFKFLDTMAGQAAIAIDNATLFNRLEQSHLELMLAYDSTLEGWARSLELHDLEAPGHAQRIVMLAQMLAQEAGLSGDELVHFRRGALLHDIGKITIPTTILNKPGKLTEEEWRIVRQHPQKSFEILSSIPFLQPAMDVPYYHHEKWDGSGYPHGLSGEQIPIGARIFALVDVWDALTSDRPYRKAWTVSDTVNYLREQTGKHFDPTLVEPFIQIVFQSSMY